MSSGRLPKIELEILDVKEKRDPESQAGRGMYFSWKE